MIYYYADKELSVGGVVLAEDNKDEKHQEIPDPDWKDRPRSFSNPANVAAARALLQEPHVRPLTQYVARLRRDLKDASVPDFDPCGGGVRARVLFVLEAPSGTGVGRGKEAKVDGGEGSGMICE